MNEPNIQVPEQAQPAEPAGSVAEFYTGQPAELAGPPPGLCPLAQWTPLGINFGFGRGGEVPRLLVVHVMQGTLVGTDAWFRDPVSEASAHFGVGRDGRLIQWVSTEDTAWHAVAANSRSIGVEHEGASGEPLSSAQMDTTGALLAWAHQHYPGLRLWLNSRPDTGEGLSWHGLGGTAWGGHPQCPGAPVVHQLPELVDVARRILATQGDLR